MPDQCRMSDALWRIPPFTTAWRITPLREKARKANPPYTPYSVLAREFMEEMHVPLARNEILDCTDEYRGSRACGGLGRRAIARSQQRAQSLSRGGRLGETARGPQMGFD